MSYTKNSNAKDRERNYEFNDEPSMTVPDMAMNIKQIKERYQNGLPLPVNYKLNWGTEDGYVEVPVMQDLTDIDDAKAFVAKMNAEIKQAEDAVDAQGKISKQRQKDIIDPSKDEPIGE